uniref:DUF397 domain-containing protein n=1 Tax=Amycolatopsis sp. CA-151526 TaxID=3239921 RepID=UPI003F4963EF
MTIENGRKRLTWITSTKSQGDNQCVEAAADGPVILMSDSKLKGAGPVVRFARPQWGRFVHEVVHELPSSNGVVVVTAGDAAIEYGAGRVELTTWHVHDCSTGAELHYTTKEWQAFRSGAADGEFAFGANCSFPDDDVSNSQDRLPIGCHSGVRAGHEPATSPAGVGIGTRTR